MNKVILIGNLTRPPELRATQSGVNVCTFSMAVNRRFKGQDGKPVTDFFNVVAWRTLGEICAKYLDKGRKVSVVGELQSRTYEDKEGVKRTITEVLAEEVEFLSPRGEAKAEGIPEGFTEIADDGDLPF